MKQLKKLLKKQGFTLVELIIVIAIIAVLAVSAFMMLTKWLGNSRDSRILSDLATIETALEITVTESTIYPMPDNYTILYASGTIVGYQGIVGSGTIGNMDNLQKAPTDPTGGYYTYRLDDKKKKFQIIGYLENDKETSYLTNNVNAGDYDNKYHTFKGYDLGLLTNSEKKPINLVLNGTGTIDVVNTTDTYTVYFEEDSITGTGKELITIAFANANNQEEIEDLLAMDDSLVGHWKFDETSGTVATDSSSYGNNGTLVGGAEWREGRIGGAIYLDGDDDLIEILSSDSLNVSNITMSAYINYYGTGESTGQYPRIISKGGDTNSEQYAFWYNDKTDPTAENNAVFQCRFDTESRDGDTGNSSPYYYNLENTWHHLVYTYDGTYSRFYLNGTLFHTDEGVFSGNINPSDNLLIIGNAGWSYGYTRAFKGLIDDTRIYNRVLSSAEIESMYSY